MTVPDLLRLLEQCPIVASVQASEGSPVDHPQVLLKLAEASVQEGVKVLRLQGVENIRTIQSATKLPVMGLIKRHYPDSHTYITATMKEVEELLQTDCEIIGIDAVIRRRPGDGSLRELIERVHSAGRLVLADIDGPESARAAVEAGADLVSTTLHGYTETTRHECTGPGLQTLRQVKAAVDVPVFAEGRYAEEWQIRAALQIGAVGVVMGSALNDPLMQTRRFAKVATIPDGLVGAVDIGGTWLRFGLFSPDWKLLNSSKVELPIDPLQRIEWIRRQVSESGASRLGVSTGGVVDPSSGEVLQAKGIIPGHAGVRFSEETLGVPTVALNDGLACAWAHACHPAYAGSRVATLAVGTGVGFGLVERGRIFSGRQGEPPHINDLPWHNTTIEGALGGAALESGLTNREMASGAFQHALQVVTNLFHPDKIVVCGSVGLSVWIAEGNPPVEWEPSPFGADAGLYGAAALALYPVP